MTIFYGSFFAAIADLLTQEEHSFLDADELAELILGSPILPQLEATFPQEVAGIRQFKINRQTEPCRLADGEAPKVLVKFSGLNLARSGLRNRRLN
jgi:hypothetical protein